MLVLTCILLAPMALSQERYIRAFERLARSAQAEAWAEHPGFQEAESLLQQALVSKARGDYQDAYDLFQRAANRFRECQPLDPEVRERAETWRREALVLRPDHPLTARADEIYARALEAQQTGQQARAAQLLELAARAFAFDDWLEQDAMACCALVPPDHPALASAQEKLRRAQALLRSRELTISSLEQATTLYREICDQLTDVLPLDEALQRVAEEALAQVPEEDARYPEVRAAWENAVAALSAGRLGQARAGLILARDLALEISPEYVPADEEAARAARGGATRTSPHYVRGLEALGAAEQARDQGQRQEAYSRFREARTCFLRAVGHDASTQREATAARLRADVAAPGYAAAEEAYRAAHARRATRDYQGAVQYFTQARDLFRALIPYDADPEKAAQAAQTQANPRVPVSFSAGEYALVKGQTARDEHRYEDAYEHFREARKHFERAVFDSGLESRLELARQGADPTALTYRQAFAMEREGRRLWEEGDGPGTQRKYDLAIALYEQARRSTVAGAGQDAGGRSPGGGGARGAGSRREDADLRAARAAATRARRNTLDQKGRCDEWLGRGTINPATLTSYREGVSSWDAAEVAYQGQRWDEARQLYEEALERLLRVSNKSR